MLPLLANSLWGLLSLPASLAFQRALGRVAGTQQRYLFDLLRRNAATEFGRRYGFAAIRSIADYQARLPLSTYDDYRPAIDRLAHGQPGVLTQEAVLLLEQTSGSTAATKYIPYTASLKAEFQVALAPWLTDLFCHDPRLLAGQAYWSVSPVARRNERTPGGIPLGFEEDSEYFGPLLRPLVQAVQAVPPHVRLIDDMATFRYVTLLFLLRSRGLTLISVWNPTFLTLLVKPLAAWWPQLASDIAHGVLSLPTPLPPDLQAGLAALNFPHPRRAAEIRSICQSQADPGAIHRQLWPRLRLISCWTEAQAGLYALELTRLFPQARLQGKGLLATEGVVSVPLVGQPGAALAVRSHFFEFLPADTPPDRPLLAHQLSQGEVYEVLLTTGGGLYRYQLHDLVEVVGHLRECPLLRFVGKAAHISDHFGEKLNERHVRQVLAALLNRHGCRPTLAMVAAEIDLTPPGYLLFIEAPATLDEVLHQLGVELDIALQENFHYRYARDLGQLAAVRVFRIDHGALEAYLAACQAHGQRAGDIKPLALHRQTGWRRAFEGRLLV
ncbi:MAG: GH3 auxin-responsive promoter family protein [Chloroflexota bacterium]